MLLVAVWLFVLTNLDTLLVIAAFCADNEYRIWEVFIGHALGLSLGLIAAIVGVLIATDFLREWAFLLGIGPLSLGIWGIFKRPPELTVERSEAVPNTVGRVGIVTLAATGLGGENLVVYIPFFVELTASELTVVIGLYLLGGVLVFLVALFMADRLTKNGLSKRIDRWLVPSVLVIVGTYTIVSGLVVI